MITGAGVGAVKVGSRGGTSAAATTTTATKAAAAPVAATPAPVTGGTEPKEQNICLMTREEKICLSLFVCC
jgi:hypothetical protein